MSTIKVYPLKNVEHYASASLLSRTVFLKDRQLTSGQVRNIAENFDSMMVVGAWATIPERSVFQPTFAGYLIYKFEFELVSLEQFAVDPSLRRAGVFRKMLEVLANSAKGKRKAIMATVRETDVDAQIALRECGFLLSYTQQPEKNVRKAADRTQPDRYTFEFVLSDELENAR